MVVPHGFQNHRRIFNKIRHATRPGTDCHEEERPRKAIRRVVIEAFTDRQIVHVFQCSTNEMPVQRPHHHRNARTDGRRWTMRPRGPPGTSAPTNAAQPWCAGPRSRGTQGRIHGRGGRPRPPAPPHAQGRCRWTIRPRGPPRTSAPTNAARTAGPRISCGAQGRMYGRGGRPRPPAPPTHRDDAGGRCVHAGRRGRRPLPTPHVRSGRAYHVARRAVYIW